MNVKTILAALLASASLAASAATYEEILSMSSVEFADFSQKLTHVELIRLSKKLQSDCKKTNERLYYSKDDLNKSENVNKAADNLIKSYREYIKWQERLSIARAEEINTFGDVVFCIMKENGIPVSSFGSSVRAVNYREYLRTGRCKIYDIEELKRNMTSHGQSATNSTSITPVK